GRGAGALRQAGRLCAAFRAGAGDRARADVPLVRWDVAGLDEEPLSAGWRLRWRGGVGARRGHPLDSSGAAPVRMAALDLSGARTGAALWTARGLRRSAAPESFSPL